MTYINCIFFSCNLMSSLLIYVLQINYKVFLCLVFSIDYVDDEEGFSASREFGYSFESNLRWFDDYNINSVCKYTWIMHFSWFSIKYLNFFFCILWQLFTSFKTKKTKRNHDFLILLFNFILMMFSFFSNFSILFYFIYKFQWDQLKTPPPLFLMGFHFFCVRNDQKKGGRS